jgi:hypothetical protein
MEILLALVSGISVIVMIYLLSKDVRDCDNQLEYLKNDVVSFERNMKELMSRIDSIMALVLAMKPEKRKGPVSRPRK